MSLTPEVVVQLEAYKNAGDAAGYYDLVRVNGHDYGNLAYAKCTPSAGW